MPFDSLLPPPLWTADLPGVGGRIKQIPEDFDVEEIPAYLPSGQGDFLYLWIEKRAMGAEYFVRQVARRLNLPPGEVGFWQAAFRDQADPQYDEACKAVTARAQMTIDVLYGDHEGGQRVITRFSIMPRGEDIWLLSAGRHWNVDRPDPR